MSELTITSLKKGYDKRHPVFQDLNFHIENKCFFVILGPSGCGKTTLLQIIAGLIKADEGDVLIDDKSMKDKIPSERNIAMVFQDSSLFEHMRVFDNIALGLKYQGCDEKEISQRVEEAAKILSIKDLLNRKASSLSGGEKQRVSIARAIVRRPKLFLMDEPLSSLDTMLKIQLRKDIRTLYEKLDATFLYVTHDQNEAMSLGDEMLLMNEGSIVQIGKPQDIYHNPSSLFAAQFLSNPKAAEIPVFVKEQELYILQERCRCSLADGHYTAIIRSKNIHKDDEKNYDFQWEGICTRMELSGSVNYAYIKVMDMELLMETQDIIEVNTKICIACNLSDIFLFNQQGKRVYVK